MRNTIKKILHEQEGNLKKWKMFLNSILNHEYIVFKDGDIVSWFPSAVAFKIMPSPASKKNILVIKCVFAGAYETLGYVSEDDDDPNHDFIKRMCVYFNINHFIQDHYITKIPRDYDVLVTKKGFKGNLSVLAEQ